MKLTKQSLVLSLALLAGCASSHVLVGTQRAPISADQVKVYLQAPAKYEEVALLESSNVGKPAFTEQSKTNTVIARLKAEAASLGANGILLQGMGSQNVGGVATSSGSTYGSGYTGTGVVAGINNKTGTAIAIYVLP